MQELEIITYRYVNFKSYQVLGFLLFSTSILSYLFYQSISKNVSNLFILCIILLFFYLLFIIYAIYKRIILTTNGIRYITPFHKRFIAWNEIKTLGSYAIFRLLINNIPLNELNKFRFLEQKFIYVSKVENYIIRSGIKESNNYIAFHYRPELLQKIQEYIDMNSTTTK